MVSFEEEVIRNSISMFAVESEKAGKTDKWIANRIKQIVKSEMRAIDL